MFDLREILRGVQAADTRREPVVPPAFANTIFGGAAIDSREVQPGELFVALSGEKTDGHQFLADVFGRGARAALVRRELVGELTLDRPQAWITPDGTGLEMADPAAVLLVAVDDPLTALQRLAAFHRGQFAPAVIGITGSVGKTTTKEAAAAVLAQRLRTLKSPRSYNSEATLPLTLLQLSADHEAAVLEMGIYGPGDLTLLAQVARPTIGVVTNVGPSHMERMGTIEAVALAKGELVAALPPSGTAILNDDDPLVRAMADRTSAQVLRYGTTAAADLWADQIVTDGLAGISFRAHYQGETTSLRLPLLGRHSVYTALAAAAVGLTLGCDWDAIAAGLGQSSATQRLAVLPGVNGSTIIDDSYNASPVSALAALDLLGQVSGRRLVAHGDMLELGPVERSAHRQVGERAAQVAAHLVVVGRRAEWIAEAAVAAGMDAAQVTVAHSNADAAQALRELLTPGDTLLVKGSRGAAMEQVVAALRRA